MSNELGLYEHGGELAPYSPDQPLAPVPTDLGYDSAPDYFANDVPQVQHTPEATQHLAQLEGLFTSDFLQLGFDHRLIRAVADCFRECFNNIPQNVTKQHRYDCFQYAADPVFNHIANRLHRLGAPQEMITSLAWYGDQLERHLGIKAVGEQAPKAVGEKWQDSFTDEEWEEVQRRNEIAKANTEAVLRARWGQSYEANIRATDMFLAGLPEHERQHFDQYTTGGIHALNSPEIITRLFDMAIGSNTLPSGGALATEIAQIEQLMRTNRRAYNNDERLQARYRTLLTKRGY